MFYLLFYPASVMKGSFLSRRCALQQRGSSWFGSQRMISGKIIIRINLVVSMQTKAMTYR